MAPPSPWAELPEELLEEFFTRLEDDQAVLACRGVCVSWRLAATRFYRKFVPLLFAFNHREDYPGFFLNVSTKDTPRRARITKPPTGSDLLIFNSSNGWLLTGNYCTTRFIFETSLHLRNPMSGTRFSCDLPPLINYFYGFASLKSLKGSISGSPRNQDFALLIILDKGGELLLAKLDRPRWTKFDCGSHCTQPSYRRIWTRFTFRYGSTLFEDIVFYKGQFYVVDHNANIYCWNPRQNHPRFMRIGSSTVPVEHDKKYLVESLSGSLLLLVRSSGGLPYFSSFSRIASATCFRVYELDSEALGEGRRSVFYRKKREWRRVSSLGDQALIVGDCGSKSLSTSSSELPLEGNSIYFIVGSVAGIYNLEIDRTQLLCECQSGASRLHWILPDKLFKSIE